MPTVLPIGINNLINGKLSDKTIPSNDFATVLENAQDKEKAKARLKEVSYEVEALFINQLLKEMRASVHKGTLFHGGSAENIFEDMLFDEYAKLMAKSDQFGLSHQIYNQLSEYM
ncbi:MAG: rod-binding protein [bacterium]|nr:rod-binding protein [bacterium]